MSGILPNLRETLSGTPLDAMIAAMSLRIRLILLVTLALAISLALGGTLACLNASHSVRTEMNTALAVAHQTVATGLVNVAKSPDWRHDAEQLVASFDGNRHLRVSLSDDAVVAQPRIEAPPIGEVPAWFVTLIGVAPATETIPIFVAGQNRGAIVVQTAPHNEILEVWNEFGDSILTMALFSGATILLIYLFVGRALRPLNRLAAGLAAIGRGQYHTRIEEALPPELSRLRDSFNRMAGELAAMAEQNRRLTGELLTLQEQERGDIARDLHDEVGPFLFAINVDAANIGRALERRRTAEIAPHLRSIAEAVGHMQKQVRDMLGRLRPIGLAEFGLPAAIGGLVEFWRRRHPEIDYSIAVDDDIEGFGETVDMVIYRLVQEGLSNSLRHGEPRHVGVSLSLAPADNEKTRAIIVTVADDGRGFDGEAGLGYGILGMSERVKAIGGNLTIDNRPGEGLTVTATLPYRSRHNMAESLLL
jgi:two-component system, NarL family, sensor histidine kinase UhpB